MQQTQNLSPWDQYWNCYVFEAIGSFFIVFAIQLAHNYEYGLFAIAISFFLSVFLAAKISGAHLNSAVTLCIFLNDMKTNRSDTPVEKYYGYVIAQIIGGTLAGMLVSALTGEQSLVDLQVQGVTGSAAFIYEMLYTGLLCFVVSILCDDHYPNKTEPALIGLLVAGVIYVQASAIGTWTGGVVNPSIGISLLLAKSLNSSVGFIHFNRVALYIIAPCVGAFGAHILYDKYVKPFFSPSGRNGSSSRDPLLSDKDKELL